jgi:hypothetical protein
MVRITSKLSEEKGLPKNIFLVATSWRKEVGKAELTLTGNSYTAFVSSDLPGKGVAKKLINKMTSVLANLAKDKDKSFSHKVNFLSKEAELKLETYYLEREYHYVSGFLLREYKP